MGVPKLSIWGHRGQICFTKRRISGIREKEQVVLVRWCQKEKSRPSLELLDWGKVLQMEMRMCTNERWLSHKLEVGRDR